MHDQAGGEAEIVLGLGLGAVGELAEAGHEIVQLAQADGKAVVRKAAA